MVAYNTNAGMNLIRNLLSKSSATTATANLFTFSLPLTHSLACLKRFSYPGNARCNDSVHYSTVNSVQFELSGGS